MIKAHAEFARKLAAGLFDMWEIWPNAVEKRAIAQLIGKLCGVIGRYAQGGA